MLYFLKIVLVDAYRYGNNCPDLRIGWVVTETKTNTIYGKLLKCDYFNI